MGTVVVAVKLTGVSDPDDTTSVLMAAVGPLTQRVAADPSDVLLAIAGDTEPPPPEMAKTTATPATPRPLASTTRTRMESPSTAPAATGAGSALIR